jgi:hypothetical protein
VSSSRGDTELPVNFQYEVDGISITTSIAWEDVEHVLGWSTSEVILYLGQSGPQLQDALRTYLRS